MMPTTDQSAVFDFLESPRAWTAGAGPIERRDTHGAVVFLAGDLALKVKRAVKLPYLDFSTLAAREATLRRELELNRPQAPSLYLDVVAITRDGAGGLAIGGTGETVEWVLRMRRFPQEALLLSIAARGAVTDELAVALADRILAYHAEAPRPPHTPDRLPATVASLMKALRAASDHDIRDRADTLEPPLRAAIAATAELRERRRAAGSIRRCHGDLHLANIVVLDRLPTLFDALEFDEALATVDTMYDLAFVLMDLDRHGAANAARIVLDRYVARSGGPLDREGLALMPLFLATRALVRAVVAIDRLTAQGAPLEPVLATLDLAERYLARSPAATEQGVAELFGVCRQARSPPRHP